MNKHLILLYFLTTITCARGQEATVREPEGLLVRESPSVESPSIGVLKFGDDVRIIDTKLTSQTINGITAHWQRVEGSNRSGWVFGGSLHIKNQCACDFTSNYKGSEYYGKCTFPTSLTKSGGGMIGSQHALDVIIRGSQTMYWFQKNVETLSTQGPALAEICSVVTDILVLQPQDLPSGYQIIYRDCLFGGQADEEIIAIARSSIMNPIITDIRAAWRANRKTGNIEKINTTKVTCKPPCLGLGCI